jgi:uncharacterized protein (TIGR02466 family)
VSLNIQLQNGVILGFPTPMVRQLVPDMDEANRALKAAILKRARKTRSAQRHNVGAWRSEDDLFDWAIPEMDSVRRAINRAVAQLTQLSMGLNGKSVRGEMTAHAWANVCRAGGYIKPHTRPQSNWSGLYVVEGDADVKDRPDSGVLELLDPRPGVDMLNTPGSPFGGSFKIPPIPGTLALYPSWLVQFVNPYFGKPDLVTIGFSVFVKGVTVVDADEASRAAE